MLLACSESVDESLPRQFSGVWLYAFEGSTFIEGATEVPRERPPYQGTSWLEYHPDQRRPGQHVEMSRFDDYDEKKECYLVHPFLVIFEGRRITDPHGSGHMGLWASEVTVDRMISFKPLSPPFCYDS
jgi:hypothetical protein